MPFDYRISIQSSWPPLGKPKPPFGATAIEVMRYCLLRSCFDNSPTYERRMGTAARIGTAMHKTLQSLSEQPIQVSGIESIAYEAKRRFHKELESQKSQANERPRETHLQWDLDRINRAEEAVIAEAIRTHGRLLSKGKVVSSTRAAGNQPELNITVQEQVQSSFSLELPAWEIPVQSKDNLFHGRIDLAEPTQEGTRIVDYKSAFRNDLPDRYARQIQLYAYLWHETTGEWPVEGFVFYPLKGTSYQIPVNEEICHKVVSEAVTLIKRLGENKRPNEIASPGDTCKICEYRAWCRPFWAWQASEKILIKAKDNASIGFEGQVESISLAEHYLRLIINWRNFHVRLIVPQERFPHLVNAKPGQLLRIMDASLKGALYQPSIQIFDSTEIFLVL